MWIYIVNFLLIFLYGILIKNKKAFVIMASLQLILLLALRAPTLGPDLENYCGGYEYISTLDFQDMLSRLRLIKNASLVYPYVYESGYVVFNWIVASLGFDFHGLLVIHAIICVAAAGKVIYKYSEDAPLSFLMFVSLGFFMYLFGILRQTLAMTIFMLSIPYIRDRKPIKYFLACFLAFTIHRAAIIVVPLYFVYNIKITKKKYVYLGWALIALLAASPLIARFVISPVLQMIGKTSYQLQFNLNIYIFVMIFIAFFVLAFTSFDDLLVNNPQNNFMCWAFLLAIAVEIMGLYNDVIARAMYIPYIAVVILVPNVLRNYKHSGISVLGKAALVCLLMAFMIFQMGGSPIVPYVTFFT